VSQPAIRPARYEDLLALPDNVVGEIVHGELVVSPRPAPRHGNAATVLAGGLNPPFQFGDGGPGGWWIELEPELHLGEHVLVPDLAGWRRERMATLPTTAYFEIAPDWVCEVISPASAKLDRGVKALLYAKHGVRHLWLVDPTARTLEVLRSNGHQHTVLSVQGKSDLIRAEPFEAIELKLARLWGE
jgi:Uma2 family endonuclease